MKEELARARGTMEEWDVAVKASQDPIKQQANLLEAQKIILAELNSEFKGSAEAAGKTFAGQMTILNNQLGNVKEEIGGALLPVLTDLIKTYGPGLVAFAKEAAKWIVSDLVPAITTTVDWMANNLVPAIKTIVEWAVVNLVPAIKDIAKWIISDLVPAVVTAVKWLVENLGPAIKTIVEWAVVNLVPAIKDIAKWIISDLVPAVVTAVKWLVENLGPIIRDIALWIVNDFVPAVKAIIEWLQEKIPPAIQTAVRVFNEIKDKINDVSNAVRDAIKWVSDLIDRIKNIRMPSLSGGLGSLFPGSNNAQGLSGMGAQSMGALGGLKLAPAENRSYQNTAFNVTINAPGGDPQKIRMAVIDGLATARARGLR
jgi:hypothetical protein